MGTWLTKSTNWTILTVMLAAAFAGCIQGPESEEGSVAFYVKDAPSDELDSVFVTFAKVEVHQASDDESEEGSDSNETDDMDNETTDMDNETMESENETEEDDGGGWTVIVDQEHTVDLKQFSGDARAFLGDENVTAGKYTQIRIHVKEAWGNLSEDGSRVNISVPNGALKIVRPWSVEAGNQTTLVVDFDLEKSILKTGAGEWKLKPVMKLIVEQGPAESTHGPASDREQGRPEDDDPDADDRGRSGEHKPSQIPA